MNTEKRASIVQEELMSLYGAPPIPLVHRDAYTLLVAVLLSAQCTDKRVNLVTPALFALASTPEEMARQDVEAVREIVRPCGLSERKASAIVNLSRILVEEGQRVEAGQLLAVLSVPRATPATGDTVTALEAQLRQRMQGLDQARQAQDALLDRSPFQRIGREAGDRQGQGGQGEHRGDHPSADRERPRQSEATP